MEQADQHQAHPGEGTSLENNPCPLEQSVSPNTISLPSSNIKVQIIQRSAPSKQAIASALQGEAVAQWCCTHADVTKGRAQVLQPALCSSRAVKHPPQLLGHSRMLWLQQASNPTPKTEGGFSHQTSRQCSSLTS